MKVVKQNLDLRVTFVGLVLEVKCRVEHLAHFLMVGKARGRRCRMRRWLVAYAAVVITRHPLDLVLFLVPFLFPFFVGLPVLGFALLWSGNHCDLMI